VSTAGERVSVRIREQVDLPSIALVTLQRPPVNAIDEPMKRELLAVARDLAHRPDLGAVVLTGSTTFSAGDDIKEMAGAERDHVLRGRELISEVCTAIAQLPVPVVAAVVGTALGGGCELALLADFRITADDAQWGLPEIHLGLIPGGGGTQRLARLIGTARAKRMVYLAESISGREAVEIGLADEATASNDVLRRAVELAEELTRRAPLALRAAKLAIDRGLALEAALFAGIFSTQDVASGLQSFVTNGPKKASFRGR
jgi:enoyl-CoA hydratase/carnithine racemase